MAYGTISRKEKNARKNPISRGGISVDSSLIVSAIVAKDAQAKHIQSAPRAVAGNAAKEEAIGFTGLAGRKHIAS